MYRDDTFSRVVAVMRYHHFCGCRSPLLKRCDLVLPGGSRRCGRSAATSVVHAQKGCVRNEKGLPSPHGLLLFVLLTWAFALCWRTRAKSSNRTMTVVKSAALGPGGNTGR